MQGEETLRPPLSARLVSAAARRPSASVHSLLLTLLEGQPAARQQTQHTQKEI